MGETACEVENIRVVELRSFHQIFVGFFSGGEEQAGLSEVSSENKESDHVWE